MRRSEGREIGRLGEHIAAEFLRRRGFTIIQANYRRPWGEIDIIAVKGNTVRFVEVKSVSRESRPRDISREIDNRPEEMVQAHKLKKIARTAMLYMEEMRDEREYQIDVVGVVMDVHARTARCRLFEQVVDDEL